MYRSGWTKLNSWWVCSMCTDSFSGFFFKLTGHLFCFSPLYCACVVDGPCAPCRCVWSLPRDVPDCRNGGWKPWNLVTPLSCDWPHPCWHGDHFYHQRYVTGCVHVCLFPYWVQTWSCIPLQDCLFNICLIFFQLQKTLGQVRSVFLSKWCLHYKINKVTRSCSRIKFPLGN